MDTTLIQLSAAGVALVPVVIGLVQLAKSYISSYWAPLLAVGFGIAGAFTVGGATFLDSQLLGGIVIGLLAAGLYSGTTTTAKLVS